MTEDNKPPESESLTRYGYALGGYNPLCGDCENRFDGDKRSWRCKPCATKKKDAYENAPQPPEEIYILCDMSSPEGWDRAYWSLIPDSKFENVKYIRADLVDKKIAELQAKIDFWEIEVRGVASTLNKMGESVDGFAEKYIKQEALKDLQEEGQKCDLESPQSIDELIKDGVIEMRELKIEGVLKKDMSEET